MLDRNRLLAAVDSAFTTEVGSTAGWPDPHDGRQPADEAYSRLTDPERWRLLGARADAWLEAIARLDLAPVERGVSVAWAEGPPGATVSRVDRAVPPAAGALPLIVARSRLGDVPDAGVRIGIGDPADTIGWFPHCGCDACDDGSQPELDRLDAHLLAVVTGRYRRLRRGDRTIQVLDEAGWSASGSHRRDDVASVLRRPTGWHELRGGPWG